MRRRKERRSTLIALGGLGLIILLGVVLFVRPGLIISMPNSAYGSSLGRTMNGGGSCSSTKDGGRLVCNVETDPGSGAGRTILLEKGSRGCWTAESPRGGGKTLEGCAGLWDVLMPSEPGGSLLGID